jgi:hypothetical protein
VPPLPDPPRHELADIDAAALEAARAADVALAAAQDMEQERWIRYLGPLPNRLRDDPLRDLRAATRVARAAYGPKDSIRDALPEYATEPLLKSIDRLQKAIARFDAHR